MLWVSGCFAGLDEGAHGLRRQAGGAPDGADAAPPVKAGARRLRDLLADLDASLKAVLVRHPAPATAVPVH